MKGLRTLFGLIGLFVSLVMPWMYLIVYLAFLLALYGGNVGDLPWTVTPTMLIMPPVLFVASIIGMAKRRSKPGAIVAGIFFLIAAGLGIYFEAIWSFPNPGVAFFTFFFLLVGIFFLLGGIFQPRFLRTKAEDRAYKLKKKQMRDGTYVAPQPGYPQQPVYPQGYPQQPVYQQPYPQQQTYQQPAAVPLYQAPANGWTCPSCGNVNDPDGRFCRSCGSPRPGSAQQTPIHPAPVAPSPEPVVPPQPMLSEPTPISEPESLLSAPVASEPTPLMESPKPVEEKTTDGWTCKLCQTKNAANSKFCKNCGSPKDVQ